MRYNAEHGITPTAIIKGRNTLLDNEQLSETRKQFGVDNVNSKSASSKGISAKSLGLKPVYAKQIADDNEIDYESVPALMAEIEKVRDAMLAAAKALDFMEAARLRDYMLALEERKKKLGK